MFELTVEVSFSAAHCIKGHPGRCAQLHGHNYRVLVTAAGTDVNDQGMVIDFATLKQISREVVDRLDHCLLNEAPAFRHANPTAELLARHIHAEVEKKLSAAAGGGARLTGVTVYESDRSFATYRE